MHDLSGFSATTVQQDSTRHYGMCLLFRTFPENLKKTFVFDHIFYQPYLPTYLSFHFLIILSSILTVLLCWGTLTTHMRCLVLPLPQSSLARSSFKSFYRPVSSSNVYVGKKTYDRGGSSQGLPG